MAWLILAAAYAAIGLAVFAWWFPRHAAMDSDRKKHAAMTLVLFPELCLFWPLALFLEIKRNPKASHLPNHTAQ